MSKGKKVPRGGVLPYYVEDGRIYVMFMKPSSAKYGGDKFQIAKGKLESGESPQVGAFRETYEETGIHPDNYTDVKYLGEFLGYTDIFYGRVKDKDDYGPTTYETDEARWIEVEEFYKIGRSLHIPIVKAFVRALTKDEPSLQNPQSEK